MVSEYVIIAVFYCELVALYGGRFCRKFYTAEHFMETDIQMILTLCCCL